MSIENGNTLVTKTAILALAEKARFHHRESEKYRIKIEQQLLSLYPSLEDKSEDGTEDWSCDVINSENDAEVLHVLQRIKDIEKKRVKTLKLKVLDDHLNKLQNEMSKIESEIAQAEAEFNKLKQS